MSSLIVVEIALARSDDDVAGQSIEWIKKRIHSLLSSAERRFDTLTNKNERVIKLHEELTEIVEQILTPDYPAWKSPESSRKTMELFFRKADRFRIVLIQLLLEENEMRLLEEVYIQKIENLLDRLVSESFISAENPAYLEYRRSVENLSNVAVQSERINSYKTLISDIATRYYTCRYTLLSLNNRIAELKKEASSLELKNVSLQDLEILHSLQGQISSLSEISDLEARKEKLKSLEEQLSALDHRVSGIEHTTLGGIPREEPDSEEVKAKIAHDVSLELLTMEAEFFHGRIGFFDYDETESSDYEPVAKETTPERLALQRENLQLEYGLLKEKIPEKTVIREDLEEIIQTLSLDPDAGALLDAAMILYHDPFPELRELSVIRRQYDAYYLQKKSKSLSDKQWGTVIQSILEAMKGRGYRVKSRKMTNLRDSFRRGSIEVFSPVSHYSIMISINPLDELVFRLVRIVDGLDIDELDPDQIQKDDAHASAVWSRDYAILQDELKKEHILFIERLKKNPDEVPIQQFTRFDILTDEHIS